MSNAPFRPFALLPEASALWYTPPRPRPPIMQLIVQAWLWEVALRQLRFYWPLIGSVPAEESMMVRGQTLTTEL